MDTPTLHYYNTNAVQFIQNTITADMDRTRLRFLNYIPPHGCILDFGCGSGRDTRFFAEAGCRVSAIDGSEELCRRASQYTGITVRHMYFQELCDEKTYDGIWACASVLHLKWEELQNVLERMARALKEDGIAYLSFKYGEYEGMRNGRYFLDMTELRWQNMMDSAAVFSQEELWLSSDARPGREDEKWLNIIVRKK